MSAPPPLIRILHLEDSFRDAEMIQDRLSLEDDHFEIVHAASRKPYEEALEQQGFDLILCDFNLQDFDGLSALKLAREKCPETPVIIVSGAIDSEEAVNCLKAGATDYLLKQRLERLPSAVQRALEETKAQKQRFLAEGRLRESERFTRATLDSLSAHVAILDESGVIIATNRTWKEFARDSNDDASPLVEGVNYLEVCDRSSTTESDDASRTATGIRAVINGETEEFVLQYPCHSPAEKRWFLCRVTRFSGDGPVRVVVAHENITAHVQAAEHIRQQARLIDQATDAIMVWDLDGRVTFWNPAAEQLYGFTAGEALGLPLLAAISREPDEKLDAILAQVREAGRWHGEMRQKTKEGRPLVVLSRLTLLADAQATPTGILSVNHDLTDAKALEHRFLRSQRQEALGTLAGGIAHDLNNALAPILLGVDLLKAQYPGAPGIVGLFDTSVRRAAAMIRQLLNFAKGTEGERSPVQINYLMREMEGIIESTFPKNITLKVACEKDLPSVVGDSTQMHQVLLNLCVNARDAMPQGGTLTLQATREEISVVKPGMPPNAKTGHYVSLVVRDTGTGIPQEIRECIFDPFFSTKSPGKGTGLGLSTVMGIIKGHDGFLEVSSKPGQGTTFAAFLPADSTPLLPEPEVPAPLLSRGQGETILFVDDEPAVREIAREVLQRLNYRVVLASDGIGGLAGMAEHKEVLRAVITDYHMPVQDGIAFVAALRRTLPDIPVVVSSGRLDRETKEKFQSMNVSAFMDQPFTEAQLMEVLRDVFAPAATAALCECV